MEPGACRSGEGACLPPLHRFAGLPLPLFPAHPPRSGLWLYFWPCPPSKSQRGLSDGLHLTGQRPCCQATCSAPGCLGGHVFILVQSALSGGCGRTITARWAMGMVGTLSDGRTWRHCARLPGRGQSGVGLEGETGFQRAVLILFMAQGLLDM